MLKTKINQKVISLFFAHEDKPGHLKALDGLRGIAILLVLLCHSSNVNIFFNEYLNFKHCGIFGVYLFFVLSAYLLDRQIAIAFMNHRSSAKYWTNYFLRRFLRIYPLFLIALFLYGFLNYIGIKTAIDDLYDLAMHMVLLKGDNMFWSVPVEFKYYFLSPIILWFCNRYIGWHTTYLFVFFTFIISLTIILEFVFQLPRVSTIKYFPVFISGTVISIYELLYMKKMKQFAATKIFCVLGILASIVVFLTIPFYFKSIFGFTMYFNESHFCSLYAILWGIILLSAKYGKGLIVYILELRFLRFIGIISYSLYLFHMIFLSFATRKFIPSELKIYVFIITSILFSSISYLLIEKPLSKIRIT